MRLDGGESGLIAKSAAKIIPPIDDEVAWVRDGDDLLTAYIRKRTLCPTHISNSVTGISFKKDKIVICYELLKDKQGQETHWYGSCPQDLIIKFDIWGLPKNVQPVFEVKQGCGNLD